MTPPLEADTPVSSASKSLYRSPGCSLCGIMTKYSWDERSRKAVMCSAMQAWVSSAIGDIYIPLHQAVRAQSGPTHAQERCDNRKEVICILTSGAALCDKYACESKESSSVQPV